MPAAYYFEVYTSTFSDVWFFCLTVCDHIICISLGWRIRKDTEGTADVVEWKERFNVKTNNNNNNNVSRFSLDGSSRLWVGSGCQSPGRVLWWQSCVFDCVSACACFMPYTHVLSTGRGYSSRVTCMVCTYEYVDVLAEVRIMVE